MLRKSRARSVISRGQRTRKRHDSAVCGEKWGRSKKYRWVIALWMRSIRRLADSRPSQSPITDSITNVANSTKWVMPSIALVSPSLRLMAATIRVIVTITVCTGVIAMMKGWPV